MTPILFSATMRPDEARDFYSRVLGFELTDESQFALKFDGAGTMVRVQKVGDFTPLPVTLIGWRVADSAEKMEELAARGAVFERFEFLQEDERGAWSAPDGAKVARFKDPDGNTLSLTEFS